MGPVLCLITDRRRVTSEDELVARVGAAARAGVSLVQVRERDLDGGALGRLVARCVAAVRGTRTRVLVNDRVDVALSAGAAGVHLRSDSMDARRVRAIAPHGFLVGRSVHDVAAAKAAGPVDYLLFGTVFETSSKPGRSAAGTEVLAQIAAATGTPVLAVGGITPARVREVALAGAAGAAAIGLFADTPLDAMAGLIERMTAAFDTPGTMPRQ
jgi:thiamine-phosphate pyrophosphorylase